MEKTEIVEGYPRRRDQLLPILHALQEASPTNSLAGSDLRLVAEHLHLPLSVVHDAVTFYSLFSLRPRGKHIVRVCDSPPCHLLGAQSVLDGLGKLLGIKVGETTPDGSFTLELTSCLGLCDVAPAMMVDDEVYGNLTPQKLKEIITCYRREK
jgi:NADH:ubiquinone oxidoreductase subunit E